MTEPTKETGRQIDGPEDAVWYALLYMLQWSNDEVRELRALAADTFIRALAQDGYSVIQTGEPRP